MNLTVRWLPWLAGILALLLPWPSIAETVEKPRIAVIMSRISFGREWAVTQMSGHGWVGIANLAGIPYDTLFLEDIAQGGDVGHYRVLVFAQCTAVDADTLARLTALVRRYLDQGGNVIIDGPLGGFAGDGQPQVPAGLWSLLGISASGVRGDATFRVQVRDNRHYITRPFEPTQYLSQSLAKGLQIQQFSSAGHVLVVSSNARESFPFLSYRDTGTNRLVLISDATTFAGATSIFRNEAPQGFFANQVVNVLVRALQWAAYGEVRGAFPAPQFSNADLAVIVRLDADNTQTLAYQKRTFQFLYEVAQETGVVPLYCLVSGAGAKAGWKELAELAQRLEDLGGRIGSHSKYHHVASGMGAEKYKEELDGSIQEIEASLRGNGAHIGKVDLFINPGDTIINSDYEEIARRFHLMMTHGFEQDTPIAFGVMNWFTGPHKDFVVLDDTPSPDYQWFYDPTWSYTTAQITSYQEATFDHLFRNLGRGYIYNQMWHDYSLSSMPVHTEREADAAAKLPRIANTSNLAMYEALKSKFATHAIYAPEPMEIVEKLRAMAGWNYSWTRHGDSLEIVLDLSPLRAATTAGFIGGMGLRIENTNARIRSVTINGQPHHAFSDGVIILPNLKPGINELKVTLSEHGASTPHLAYVSSRMPEARQTAKGFKFQLLTHSRARFAIHSPLPGLVLHADWQEFNRRGDHVLAGHVTSDRTLHYVPFTRKGVALSSATVPIGEVREGRNLLSFTLEEGSSPLRQLAFSSVRPPSRIRLNGRIITAERSQSEYVIALPEYKGPASLEILWPETSAPVVEKAARPAQSAGSGFLQ